jgi:transcriptional regulator with XRE-family HTH domain
METGCTDATIMGGVNWIRVRELLADCREQSNLNASALARKMGVHKSTIHRIENVRDLPDYTTDLETIEAWTRATGMTLSSFFAQIETLSGTSSEAQNLRAQREVDVDKAYPDLFPNIVKEGESEARAIKLLIGLLVKAQDEANRRQAPDLGLEGPDHHVDHRTHHRRLHRGKKKGRPAKRDE